MLVYQRVTSCNILRSCNWDLDVSHLRWFCDDHICHLPIKSTLGIMSNLFPLSKSRCWVSPFEVLIENHGDPHVFRIFFGGENMKNHGKTMKPHALPMRGPRPPSSHQRRTKTCNGSWRRCSAATRFWRSRGTRNGCWWRPMDFRGGRRPWGKAWGCWLIGGLEDFYTFFIFPYIGNNHE